MSGFSVCNRLKRARERGAAAALHRRGDRRGHRGPPGHPHPRRRLPQEAVRAAGAARAARPRCSRPTPRPCRRRPAPPAPPRGPTASGRPRADPAGPPVPHRRPIAPPPAPPRRARSRRVLKRAPSGHGRPRPGPGDGLGAAPAARAAAGPRTQPPPPAPTAQAAPPVPAPGSRRASQAAPRRHRHRSRRRAAAGRRRRWGASRPPALRPDPDRHALRLAARPGPAQGDARREARVLPRPAAGARHLPGQGPGRDLRPEGGAGRAGGRAGPACSESLAAEQVRAEEPGAPAAGGRRRMPPPWAPSWPRCARSWRRARAPARSLSDVLNETMQQHEAVGPGLVGARGRGRGGAGAAGGGARGGAREQHARAVASLEADRADERARLEQARAEVEAAAQAAPGPGGAGAAGGARGGRGGAGRRPGAPRGAHRRAGRAGGGAAAAHRGGGRAASSPGPSSTRARPRSSSTPGRGRTRCGPRWRRRRPASGSPPASGTTRWARRPSWRRSCSAPADARKQLEEMLKHARAETRAHEEKAISAEHAHQARSAELVAAGQRIADLTSALDAGPGLGGGDARRAGPGGGEPCRGGAAGGRRGRRRATRWRARWRRPAARGRGGAGAGEAAGGGGAAAGQAGAAGGGGGPAAQGGRLAPRDGPAADPGGRGGLAGGAGGRGRAGQGGGAALGGGRPAAGRGDPAGGATWPRPGASWPRWRPTGTPGRPSWPAPRAELERSHGEVARRGGRRGGEAEGGVGGGRAIWRQRHQAEVARLKAAMVELEKHLETRSRAEIAAKKKLAELERAAAAPRPAAPDAAETARLKEALRKVDRGRGGAARGERLPERRGGPLRPEEQGPGGADRVPEGSLAARVVPVHRELGENPRVERASEPGVVSPQAGGLRQALRQGSGQALREPDEHAAYTPFVLSGAPQARSRSTGVEPTPALRQSSGQALRRGSGRADRLPGGSPHEYTVRAERSAAGAESKHGGGSLLMAALLAFLVLAPAPSRPRSPAPRSSRASSETS